MSTKIRGIPAPSFFFLRYCGNEVVFRECFSVEKGIFSVDADFG
jgi:hypothetical protein